MAALLQDCDIMIDQIRAIDNQRLQKKIGRLPEQIIDLARENIRICLQFG